MMTFLTTVPACLASPICSRVFLAFWSCSLSSQRCGTRLRERKLLISWTWATSDCPRIRSSPSSSRAGDEATLRHRWMTPAQQSRDAMGGLVGPGRSQASQLESEHHQQDAEHQGIRSNPDHQSERSRTGEEYQQHPERDG